MITNRDLNTDQYIQQFKESDAAQQPTQTLSQQFNHFMYRHPTTVKVAQASGVVLGLAAIALLPLSFPAIGIAAAVTTAVGGGVTAAASGVAHGTLDLVTPPHHDMKTHVFKPATYGVAKLYYQGDIPILELKYDDPFFAGHSHAYLMAEYFENLLNQMSLVKRVMQLPNAQDVPETLHAIMELLPEEYVIELEGMVAGYNQWLEENRWLPKKITIEDVLVFHLMPDSLHFSPEQVEAALRGEESSISADENQSLVGCTVVVDKDKDKGLTVGRNMDWPSFGLFGTYSLIINRKHKNDKLSTVELGFPGFVGSLTGMNKMGLSAAMNVCSSETSSVEGLPAAFYNRMCLERYSQVNEIEKMIKHQSPLGAYHLSVADRVAAKSFHFFQGSKGKHIVRTWQAGKPLITTNCQYLSNQNGCERGNLHCSIERKRIIDQFFNGAKKQISQGNIQKHKLVESSLSLPYVNNALTVHKMVMYPQSKNIRMVVDNAFAGQAPFHELNTAALFN